MDIDIVYTWVNSKDIVWQQRRAEFARNEIGLDYSYCAGESRFRDNNELKYSLRSVECFLPFIRRVFIVHTGAAPDWLRNDCSDLIFVPQGDILPSHCSPSYQSDVIESFLYKIPELSEHYIYSNDDFFFRSPHNESDLFDSNDKARVGITLRLAGDGEGIPPMYLATELNSGRAIAKHLNIPKPTIVTRYPWMPLFVRCFLKGIVPVNTMTHVAQPFRKSIWQEFHEIFSKEIAILCQHRFRSQHGFIVNMMAHYYALSVDKAVFSIQDNYVIGRARDADYRAEFRQRIFENNSQVKRFCLNDEVSSDEDGWDDYIYGILNTLFPKPSRWEI